MVLKILGSSVLAVNLNLIGLFITPGSTGKLRPCCQAWLRTDLNYKIVPSEEKNWKMLKSVQSALSDLKRPPERLSPSAIIGLSLLNSILMACFLKQSFTQTCLKETDNGKLQQFNYFRGTGNGREKGSGCIAKNYYAPLGRET